MKEIKLYRDGKRPLVFNGEEIASASTRDNNSTRWTRAEVYRSKSGKVIVGVAHLTCWQGERDSFQAAVFTTTEEAVSYIELEVPEIAPEIADALGVKETI
jgi:hypothetical protein